LKDYELERLLTKFSENDFEKIERLIELHEKYAKSITTADRDIKDQILDAEETGGASFLLFLLLFFLLPILYSSCWCLPFALLSF
jgi:hypothetical protein